MERLAEARGGLMVYGATAYSLFWVTQKNRNSFFLSILDTGQILNMLFLAFWVFPFFFSLKFSSVFYPADTCWLPNACLSLFLFFISPLLASPEVCSFPAPVLFSQIPPKLSSSFLLSLHWDVLLTGSEPRGKPQFPWKHWFLLFNGSFLCYLFSYKSKLWEPSPCSTVLAREVVSLAVVLLSLLKQMQRASKQTAS